MSQKPDCSEYRKQMMLAGLLKQAADPRLAPAEREKLQLAIRRLKAELAME